MADKPTKRRKIKGKVTVLPERCKGCGFCVEFCPTHVLAIADTFNAKGYHPPFASNPDACTGCDLCVAPCPVDCIDMVVKPAPLRWHWQLPTSIAASPNSLETSS